MPNVTDPHGKDLGDVPEGSTLDYYRSIGAKVAGEGQATSAKKAAGRRVPTRAAKKTSRTRSRRASAGQPAGGSQQEPATGPSPKE